MAPRLTLLVLLALLAAGCGAEDEAAAPQPGTGGEPLAELVVRVDPDGGGPKPQQELRLSCDSAQESRACAAAAGLTPEELAPVEGDTACTDIFGGPEKAWIRGRLRGDEVDARFSRSNGCEIGRWDGVADLLTRAG